MMTAPPCSVEEGSRSARGSDGRSLHLGVSGDGASDGVSSTGAASGDPTNVTKFVVLQGGEVRVAQGASLTIGV